MRLTLTCLALACLSLPLHADPLKIDSDRDRISYSVGHQIGLNFKHQTIDINPEVLGRGLQDAWSGAPAQMGEAEMDKARADLRRMMVAAQQAQEQKAAAAKIAAGQAFLAANAKKAGVTVLPSGLQYRVIQEGHGKKPGPQDQVSVHYRGTLIDGSEFDSSYRRNQPASFALNGVIAGWTEGLQLMQEGAKYELVLAPALAYGDHGHLANETLIFEVELLSVEAAK